MSEAFQCEECSLASPDDCQKAGHCPHRDGDFPPTTVISLAPGSPLQRSLAQFFFEVGYAACFAEVVIQQDMQPPFALSDEHIEAAWPRSIEAHEDAAEIDRALALTNAAPDMLQQLRVASAQFRFYEQQHRAKPPTDDTLEKARVNQAFADRIDALIAKATGA